MFDPMENQVRGGAAILLCTAPSTRRKGFPALHATPFISEISDAISL